MDTFIESKPSCDQDFYREVGSIIELSQFFTLKVLYEFIRSDLEDSIPQLLMHIISLQT